MKWAINKVRANAHAAEKPKWLLVELCVRKKCCLVHSFSIS